MKLRLRVVRWMARVLRVPRGLLADDPWMRVLELPDAKDRAYVWILGEGAKPADLTSFLANLNAIYVETLGHEPLSLHIVVAHPVQLQELTPNEVRTVIRPWLKDQPKTPEE